jgi:hypothetical protein
MHLMKGVDNLVDARQELARVERELAAGRNPFAVVVKEAVGALLNRWTGCGRWRRADSRAGSELWIHGHSHDRCDYLLGTTH